MQSLCDILFHSKVLIAVVKLKYSELCSCSCSYLAFSFAEVKWSHYQRQWVLVFSLQICLLGAQSVAQGCS